MLSPSFGEIDLDQIEPKSYRAIVQAWCDQREGRRFPLKEKIDPFVIPALAAHLLLYEIDGDDLIFRVVGDKVVTTAGVALKGKTLLQAMGDTTYTRIIERQLKECATTGVPLYSIHDFQLPGEFVNPLSRKAWRIALPYGDDQGVTRLLCYQLFSREISAASHEEIDFETLLPKTVFKIRL